MNVELEIAVIKKFVKKDKQDRYIRLLSSKKRRVKFIKALAHFSDFNPDKMDQVNEPIDQYVLAKIQKLAVNASRCYVISENSRLDQQPIDTSLALQEIIGYGMGAIIVFGNADIIYYEGEEPKNRLISK